MKITPKQYATALYESVEGKNQEDIGQVIKKFAKTLFVNNDINKSEAVLSEFVKLWNVKNKVVDATVISANEIAEVDLKVISDYIKKISKAETVNLETNLDKTLLGGLVLKYGDKVLDSSLRMRLGALSSKMKS